MIEMFAKKVKELRKIKKIPQAELAKEFNVAQQTVAKWEKGLAYPNIDTLKQLASYFNVSIDYLLDNDVVPASTALADEETNLVSSFRKLNEESKRLILGMIGQLTFSQRTA